MSERVNASPSALIRWSVTDLRGRSYLVITEQNVIKEISYFSSWSQSSCEASSGITLYMSFTSSLRLYPSLNNGFTQLHGRQKINNYLNVSYRFVIFGAIQSTSHRNRFWLLTLTFGMVVDFDLHQARSVAYVGQGGRSKVKVNFQRWCLINTRATFDLISKPFDF